MCFWASKSPAHRAFRLATIEQQCQTVLHVFSMADVALTPGRAPHGDYGVTQHGRTCWETMALPGCESGNQGSRRSERAAAPPCIAQQPANALWSCHIGVNGCGDVTGRRLWNPARHQDSLSEAATTDINVAVLTHGHLGTTLRNICYFPTSWSCKQRGQQAHPWCMQLAGCA